MGVYFDDGGDYFRSDFVWEVQSIEWGLLLVGRDQTLL